MNPEKVLLRQKAYTQVIKPRIEEYIRRIDDGRVTRIAVQIEVIKLFEQSKRMCLNGFEPEMEYKRIRGLLTGKIKPQLESYFEAVAYLNRLPEMLMEIRREIQRELERRNDILLHVAKSMVEEKLGLALSNPQRE